MKKTALRLLPLALLLVASSAAAQRSQLDLAVVDMSGNELGPVNVTVTSPEGEIVVQKATGKNGQIKIRLKPADGPYKILLEKDGYPNRETEVEITDGRADKSLKLQLWDEAAATRQQAIDAFNDGIRSIQGGDAESALDLFQQAVDLDPTLAAAHRTIAAIHHGMGNLEEALAPLDKYMSMEALPPEFAGLAFDVFLAADDPRVDEAKQMAVEAGMSEEVAAGVFSQGVQAVRNDDNERAVELFAEAAALNPKLYQAYRNIGTIHFNNQNWEPALEALEQTLELDPRNTEAMRMRFFSYVLQGQLEASIEAGRAWLAVNPTAGRQVQHQADQLFKDEAYGNVKLYDQSLIAWDDNHPRAHFRLGVIYRRSADSALAKEHLTKYLETAPEDEADRSRAHYELGLLAVNASDADAAREHLTKFLEMAPNDENADVARAALDQL